jgi:NAD(P)-dependent dehydrogenase (short-subunit alcohol dehydrogenase family)
VIFTSSPGGVHYVLGPAYGAHKAGMDKFAADMAVDFKEHNVAALSIWMGGLRTDRLKRMIAAEPAKYGHLTDTLETPQFTGHIIWALYNDPKLMEMSGQTVIGAEIAVKYGIKDEGGRQPPSYRDTHKVAPRVQYPGVVR